MRFKKAKSLIRKYDFIEMKTIFNNTSLKYLVLTMGKETIKMLPILEIDGISAACPIMIIPYKFIKSLTKIKSSRLLFYSNLNSAYIDEAILKNADKRKKMHAELPVSLS